MADETLTPRDLNRTLLARQMLLERQEMGPVEALERLFAVQGQVPRAPFIGLWTRLKGFRREDLLKAIQDRQVVRSTFMRSTLHLASARDVLAFRTTIMPPRDITLPGGVKPTPAEIDRILELSRAHFAEPQDFESVRAVLEAAGIEPVRPLAYAARIFLPLVQASSDTAYGYEPGGAFTLARTWLGQDEAAEPQPQALARRYLAAYGPSLPGDFATWSGLKGAAAILEAIGDDLATFKDERKRTLYDLKNAPLVSGETPAPVRLLPDFDSAVMGRTDRTGIVPEGKSLVTSKNLLIPPVVLVDGVSAGTWKLEVKKKSVAVAIRLLAKTTAKDRKAIEAEAVSAVEFLAPGVPAAVAFEEA